MATQPVETGGNMMPPPNGAEVIAPSKPERNYEAEAFEKGWRPLEEFKGDPAKFKDAEAFIKQGEEILPLVLKELNILKRENGDLKKSIKRLTAAEQRAYEHARADLEAKQDTAAEVGDVAELRRLREEGKKLAETVENKTHGESPIEELASFREENAWFDRANLASASDDEKEARRYADIIADKWIGQGLPAQIPPSEFYRRLSDEVRERFPNLGRKPLAPKPLSDVAATTRPGARTAAKSFAGLPPEAKSQFERFFDDGIYKGEKAVAREKYAKVYWENQA